MCQPKVPAPYTNVSGALCEISRGLSDYAHTRSQHSARPLDQNTWFLLAPVKATRTNLTVTRRVKHS